MHRISRSFRLVPALAALAIIAAAPLHAQRTAPPERVQLTGRLVDRETGEPVRGARIEVLRPSVIARTDENGVFRLPPLRRGQYDVDVSELGYMKLQLRLGLTRDDTVTFRMTPDPVMLEGLVVFAKAVNDRSARSTVSSRAFDRDRMRTFGGGNMLAFLELNSGVRPVPCGGPSIRYQCAYVRGGPEPVTVYIDGLPAVGGLEDLTVLPVQEVFHVNVYRGGSVVEVITEHYARQETHKRIMHPLLPGASPAGVQYQWPIRDLTP